MGDSRHFIYQTADAQGEWDVRLAGQLVAVAGGWSVELGDVTGATFVNRVTRGIRTVRLELFAGETCHALGFTGPDRGYQSDENARTHLSLLVEILDALHEVAPHSKVTLGVTRGGKGLFLLGLGALVAGLVLLGSMLSSEVPAERLVSGGIPAVGLVLVGALLFVGRAPWKRSTTVQPGVLAETLRRVLG